MVVKTRLLLISCLKLSYGSELIQIELGKFLSNEL